ncbi:putative Secretion protein HlyD [Nostocoides japonicum T1-X7]|uniref:Putative Secretion protein HlyD n=1 Tax=Nostocoides japonicum T1-X7 TaxID=1194083 RepID=A0A077M5R7_9MICO|nr:HlyD family efflux transporter periplasmic adaptor subunit [Tetrasphaera japonica]CCH79514.1 putative Secretion protein HlyD [Tetrasphaera japonica T1-X7]
MAESRTRLIRRVAAGCAVAVVLAGAYLVVGTRDSDAATSSLVTSTASLGDVTQTATLSGTVERVDEVSATFPTAGTVTSVKVAVGASVREGQTLATMDTTDLKQSVSVAQADLVAAQAALEDAEDGTSSTSASGATSTSGSGSASAARATTSGSTATATEASVVSRSDTSARRSTSTGHGSSAKPVDTSKAGSSVASTSTLLAAAQTACAPVVTPPSTGTTTPTPTSPATTPTPTSTATMTPTTASSSTTTSPSSTSSSTTSPSPTSSSPTSSSPTSPGQGPSGPTPEQVSACITAIGKAIASARDSATVLSSLSRQIEQAADALQRQAATATTGTSSAGSGTSRGSGGTGGSGADSTPSGRSGSSGSSGAGGAGSGGQGGGQSTASLQVAVLKDQQALAAAQQNLAGATLKAPISGVVGSIGIATGQAASTSDAIVVVGKGSAVLTATASLAQIGAMRTGQAVTVTPAGTSAHVPGTIASIGVVPADSTSSAPTYPVRITVSDAPQTLATGSRASATVTLASARNAVTVPVSALSGVSSSSSTVEVLAHGTATPTRVTVGAVGGGEAQITAGLSKGAVVVIADRSVALPSSDSTALRRTVVGVPGGGFTGGGGVGGAGFGGPPGG